MTYSRRLGEIKEKADQGEIINKSELEELVKIIDYGVRNIDNLSEANEMITISSDLLKQYSISYKKEQSNINVLENVMFGIGNALSIGHENFGAVFEDFTRKMKNKLLNKFYKKSNL